MKKTLFLTLSAVILSAATSKGTTKEYSSTDTSNAETVKVLKGMQSSMNGKTSKGYTYNMYAVKAKKDWVFLILDTLSIYSMKFDEASNQLVETDKSYTEVLCLAAKSGSLSKKEKASTIAGTKIECYYKMQGKAAKMYKSVKKMNTKVKDIMSKTRKEYRTAKSNKSKAKGLDKKLKRAEKSKGKSLL
jgi:hypothetical protein